MPCLSLKRWCHHLYGNGESRRCRVQCGHEECIERAKRESTFPWFCDPASGIRDCFNLHIVHGYPPSANARKKDTMLKRKWEDIEEGDTNGGRVSPSRANRGDFDADL